MNWRRVTMAVLAVQTVMIGILLWVLVGAVFVHWLLHVLMLAAIIGLGTVAVRFYRIASAAREGMQYVYDAIASNADEFERSMQEIVWAGDQPEFRHMSRLMRQSRDLLRMAPELFNRGTAESLVGIDVEVDEDDGEEEMLERQRLEALALARQQRLQQQVTPSRVADRVRR